MNALYSLIHTAVVFVAGSSSILAVNSNLAFAVDLVLMGIIATVIYSYLFEKTHHNVLYIPTHWYRAHLLLLQHPEYSDPHYGPQ